MVVRVRESYKKNLGMGVVVRSKEVFKKILTMGEWAPLPPCRSSPTPPPLCVSLLRARACVPPIMRACHASQNRTVVLFYRIARSCFFIRVGDLSFQGIAIGAVYLSICVCLYVH